MHKEAVKENELFNELAKSFDRDEYNTTHEVCTFKEYLDKVQENPRICFSAYQRCYDMMVLPGVEKFKRFGKTIKRYKFFSANKHHPIFGIEESIEELIEQFKGAAGYFGPEKRMILLRGPVGSAKSTVCRAIKRGLEEYSLTDRAPLYTFTWVGIKDIPDLAIREEEPCPMHDDPLKLIPVKLRKKLEKKLNERLAEIKFHEDETLNKEMQGVFNIRLTGELNPLDQLFYDKLLNHYHGDWATVLEKHIRVERFVISEPRRIGIGTFQPKDEKNQDATELTGDINFAKLAKIGSDSDARAFNFDGEYEVANRGVLELIEVLKLNREFLYDILGATQEQQIKPKKFAQVGIDLCIISHTNLPEYQKLEKDDCMEALRDRTIKVDFGYNLRWSDETKILQQDYNKEKIRQHIAPHTIETASLFAILTRLHSIPGSPIDLVKKAKLYDGKSLPEFTEESVRELKEKTQDEGLKQGISPRYIQNKISNALVKNHIYINPFMVLNELKEGLKHYPAIGDSQELRAHYENCIDLTKAELGETLKNEVMRALVMDEDAMQRMFLNYMDNMFAYIHNEKVDNEYTGEREEPDEVLMRSIEEKIGIPETHVNEFRKQMAAFLGHISTKQGRDNLRWDSNPKLQEAIQRKLFEDVKGTIKLSSLSKVVGMIDPAEQEKIDKVKQRLIRDFGYNEQSAKDTLHYVGSLFARGEAQAND
jgi:serine protein kinase